MNELQVFKNEQFGQIRWTKVNGKDYAVAIDIAKALGYKDPNSAVTRHCKGSVKHLVPTNSGEQMMNIIPEGDIYRLTAKSELPTAEKFESWIFDEVLPSIRKNGAYLTDEKIDEILSDPDTIIKLATQLKLERQKRKEIENVNNILMHVNKTYTATEIAKELGFKSAVALNKELGEKKIQFKQNDTWVLYSKYADKGYVEIKQEVLDNGRVIYHRKWTQLGREFLLKLYGIEELQAV